MKKIMMLILLSLLLIGSMTGCGKDNKEKVYVYNWGEYIDPAVVKSFEKETGIKVVYDKFDTNEEMYAKVKSGAIRYDVLCPSDYMIQKMIQEDMLAEIDFNKVPNIKNIDPAQLKTSQDFDPENQYSVPYCWGTLGILYNKEMVDGPIDSWAALFDKKYKGNILMMDSVRDAFAVALAYLGYDINTTDESQLNKARDLLLKQYPLVQAYVVDQVRDKMIGNEAAIGVIYSGEAIFTKRENPDLEYVVPKEGSNAWIDGWVIPKNCRNKENAEKFINYMCDGDIALKNFEFITYSTPNKVAREKITDKDIKNSKVAFPDQSVLDRCSTYKYLGDKVEAIYNDKWNQVKSGISD